MSSGILLLKFLPEGRKLTYPCTPIAESLLAMRQRLCAAGDG